MSQPWDAGLVGMASAGVVTWLCLPLWRRCCGRLGLVDDPGPRKIHSAPIPLAGGLAVLTGLLGPLFAGVAAWRAGWLESTLTRAFAEGACPGLASLVALGGGALAMLLLGLADDRLELRPGLKFAGQLLIALWVAMAGVRVTLFVPSVLFSYALTLLWILTVTNAFNFMDNMNGLCAGIGLIGAGCFGGLALWHGQPFVGLVAWVVAGALLGFLPHNFPRARAFLGDGGSHLVGFLLSVLAILPQFYSSQHPHRRAVLAPLLVLGVPLLDLAWVVLRRWHLGRPFYVGDTNHLSHCLVRRGLSPVAAVILLWLLACCGGTLAFCL